MKAAVLVLFASLVSTSAFALESFYGRVSYSGGEYYCTFTNNTGGSLDFKYVNFGMERRAGRGDNREFRHQERIDSVVRSGETITAGSGLSMRYIANDCKFQAR